jgi:hypothetical protein
MTFWILVLLLVKTDGSGGPPAQIGPFPTKESCERAGAKWRNERIGGADVNLAAFECRPMKGQ